MSLFVEVNSLEKNTKVIINMEHIVEIAPLREGGCALFFNDGAAVGGVRPMKVKDSYTQFKQFAMQTVSSDMIADRIASLKGEEKRGPGRPKKEDISMEIPTL